MPGATLSLKECAQRLGVHYMTVYRYVRLGMLEAHKVGGVWRVAAPDLESFLSSRRKPVARREAPWTDRLEARLLAGDHGGSLQVIETALAAGLQPSEVELEVIAPAMRSIGVRWEQGTATIADEHRASAIATRLIGVLGSRFAGRGRRRGTVILGTPPGERHALPGAIVADHLRRAGYEVIDLGCDLPVESFVSAAEQVRSPAVIAVSVNTSDVLPAARLLIEALHGSGMGPILVGGGAVVDGEQAATMGADGYAADGAGAVEELARLTARKTAR